MKNNIIIPIIVIIICIVIVYGILSYRYNKKIINTIESFQANLQINNINKFKSSLNNNTEITSEIANGSWTTAFSTVDSNYNITGNNMIIDVHSKQIDTNNYDLIFILKSNIDIWESSILKYLDKI
jgi:alpha-N-acetylglucosamine transferase